MERGELRHGAKRGVFFDFDSTMTTPIKLPRFHRHAIADSPEIFASMTPQEILANFGGRPRLQRMGKLLQALTEAGCELFIVSIGFRDTCILPHLHATGLLQHFRAENTAKDAQKPNYLKLPAQRFSSVLPPEAAADLMADRRWTPQEALFVDDSVKHVESAADTCEVVRVQGNGMSFLELDAIERFASGQTQLEGQTWALQADEAVMALKQQSSVPGAWYVVPVIARILKVKPHELEVTMISPSQLEGRALSDVKLGDVLDGKVVGKAKNSLFMDIGCVALTMNLPEAQWQSETPLPSFPGALVDAVAGMAKIPAEQLRWVADQGQRCLEVLVQRPDFTPCFPATIRVPKEDWLRLCWCEDSAVEVSERGMEFDLEVLAMLQLNFRDRRQLALRPPLAMCQCLFFHDLRVVGEVAETKIMDIIYQAICCDITFRFVSHRPERASGALEKHHEAPWLFFASVASALDEQTAYGAYQAVREAVRAAEMTLHVDTLSIINVPEMENFIGYWNGVLLENAMQRTGFMYGYYLEERAVHLRRPAELSLQNSLSWQDKNYDEGTRAIMEGIYEPSQEMVGEIAEPLTDDQEMARVNRTGTNDRPMSDR
eukprot:g26094.t1